MVKKESIRGLLAGIFTLSLAVGLITGIVFLIKFLVYRVTEDSCDAINGDRCYTIGMKGCIPSQILSFTKVPVTQDPIDLLDNDFSVNSNEYQISYSIAGGRYISERTMRGMDEWISSSSVFQNTNNIPLGVIHESNDVYTLELFSYPVGTTLDFNNKSIASGTFMIYLDINVVRNEILNYDKDYTC